MKDYGGTALAPAFWKLSAYPEHPVVLTRLHPDGPFRAATYEVDSEAQVTPNLEFIGRGLFKASSYYKVTSGEIRERESYYLVAGRFSLIALSDGLGAAIEGALA